MCDVLLPPGVNPTAVKYIQYIIYHIITVFKEVELWHVVKVCTLGTWNFAHGEDSLCYISILKFLKIVLLCWGWKQKGPLKQQDFMIPQGHTPHPNSTTNALTHVNSLLLIKHMWQEGRGHHHTSWWRACCSCLHPGKVCVIMLYGRIESITGNTHPIQVIYIYTCTFTNENWNKY
jgi:hypothetical protein